MDENEFPEVEKYLDQEDRFLSFKSFLEWLTSEKGITFIIVEDPQAVQQKESFDYYPRSIMQLVAEYMDIDLAELERQKQVMLRQAMDRLKYQKER